jgi:hypothetical protein
MAISLEKRTESVKINLTKKSIQNINANVCLMIDISGSMGELFRNGVVQETIDRVFAIAMNMDPDKALDVFVFNYGSKKLTQMKESHYGNYVQSVLLRETQVGGGTNYGPVINEVTTFYKPETATIKKSGGFFGIGAKVEEIPVGEAQPIYAIFITDGANDDRAAAMEAFARTATGNVYFQCVGIGDSSQFSFIEGVGEKFDHVGFMNLNKLDISDEDLYEKLINEEFVEWIKPFVK